MNTPHPGLICLPAHILDRSWLQEAHVCAGAGLKTAGDHSHSTSCARSASCTSEPVAKSEWVAKLLVSTYIHTPSQFIIPICQRATPRICNLIISSSLCPHTRLSSRGSQGGVSSRIYDESHYAGTSNAAGPTPSIIHIYTRTSPRSWHSFFKFHQSALSWLVQVPMLKHHTLEAGSSLQGIHAASPILSCTDHPHS